MTMAAIARDVFVAFVRVLHPASEEPIYGLTMIEELVPRDHGAGTGDRARSHSAWLLVPSIGVDAIEARAAEEAASG